MKTNPSTSENREKLVFASHNPHKAEEYRQILGERYEIVSLDELGIDEDIPETGDTLEENALLKARWVRDRLGVSCFADDTGLEVSALGGAPGVYSARFAGEGCTPQDNVRLLLEKLSGCTDRSACFRTVIALITPEGEKLFEGRVDGRIAGEPSGEGGFGYDPVFVPDGWTQTFAEAPAEEKNAISHRGRAMRNLELNMRNA